MAVSLGSKNICPRHPPEIHACNKSFTINTTPPFIHHQLPPLIEFIQLNGTFVQLYAMIARRTFADIAFRLINTRYTSLVTIRVLPDCTHPTGSLLCLQRNA